MRPWGQASSPTRSSIGNKEVHKESLSPPMFPFSGLGRWPCRRLQRPVVKGHLRSFLSPKGHEGPLGVNLILSFVPSILNEKDAQCLDRRAFFSLFVNLSLIKRERLIQSG